MKRGFFYGGAGKIWFFFIAAIAAAAIFGLPPRIMGLAKNSSSHDQEIFDIHVRPFIRPELTGTELRALAETHLYTAKYMTIP